MTNIYKRDSSWTMFRPGLYLDPDGNAHVFPDEVIAEMQRLFPEVPWDVNSQADYDLCVRAFQDSLREAGLRPATFIKHEREQN